LNLFVHGKDCHSLDITSYDFNFYNDQEMEYTNDKIIPLMIRFSTEFYNFDNTKKLELIKKDSDSYKKMIQLFISGFLNKWYLTEKEDYIIEDIYMRNSLLITLELLLDVDIELSVGNITIKQLYNIISILSYSLYYDDTIISYDAYLENNDILHAPAYSAIGRGFDNIIDYKLYKNYMMVINNHHLDSMYDCPFSFDHKLSLILQSQCDYTEFMLENTNKFNLINLYQNGTSSFILSDRFIYSFQEAIQYYGFSSSLIYNRYKFNENYPIIKNTSFEGIVEELFTPYRLEKLLYKLKKYNKNILPYCDIYFLNEFYLMSKNAVSLFNVYSDMMLTLKNILIANDYNVDSTLAGILYDLYKDIKLITNDVANADDVDEYNNIVRMFNYQFVETINVFELFEEEDKVYKPDDRDDFYIEFYPSYFPDNQLLYELDILSKYSNEPIKIDNNGKVTESMDHILTTISNRYKYKNDDIYNNVNTLIENSQLNLLFDFGNIIAYKSITNYYGDYYSDDIHKYIKMVNDIALMNSNETIYDDIDEFESSGDTEYKNTNSTFNYITDTLDHRFMTYYLNYIIHSKKNDLFTSELKNVYNLINDTIEKSNATKNEKRNLNYVLYLNKLYCIYNRLLHSYNIRLSKLTGNKPKNIQIDLLDEYIKNLIENNYSIDYSFNDITMLNNIKFYLFNQSPFKRDENIVRLIERMDSSFVRNMYLYNIYDALERVKKETIPADFIYDLLIQSYIYESKDTLKEFINLLNENDINDQIIDLSIFTNYF